MISANDCLRLRGKLVEIQHDPVTVSVRKANISPLCMVIHTWEGVPTASTQVRRPAYFVLSFLEDRDV